MVGQGYWAGNTWIGYSPPHGKIHARGHILNQTLAVRRKPRLWLPAWLRRLRRRKPRHLGVALAGGGARGLAHIGVLQVLHERGIAVHRLAGTSAGAIVAAMYAARPDPDWVEARMREFLESEPYRQLAFDQLVPTTGELSLTGKFKRHVAVNLFLLKSYLLPRQRLVDAVEFLLPVNRFEDLALPLTVSAVDLHGGDLLDTCSGDLVEAVCDSAAIPGVFELRADGGRLIADGAVLAPVPVHALTECDYTIASDINHGQLNPLGELNIFALMVRAERLSQSNLAHVQAAAADLVVGPEVGATHWAAFEQLDHLVAAGKIACTRALRAART